MQHILELMKKNEQTCSVYCVWDRHILNQNTHHKIIIMLFLVEINEFWRNEMKFVLYLYFEWIFKNFIFSFIQFLTTSTKTRILKLRYNVSFSLIHIFFLILYPRSLRSLFFTQNFHFNSSIFFYFYSFHLFSSNQSQRKFTSKFWSGSTRGFRFHIISL